MGKSGNTNTARIESRLGRFIVRIVARLSLFWMPKGNLSDESTKRLLSSPDTTTSQHGRNESWGISSTGELYGPIARSVIAMNNRADAALGSDFEGRVLSGEEERYIFGDLFNMSELNAALEFIAPQMMSDCAEHPDDMNAVLCGIWTRAMCVGALHERMRHE